MTEKRTLHAYAIKSGMANSRENEITVEAKKPQTPIVELADTKNKLAVGKTAVFRWAADAKAKNYAVSVYKDGKLQKTTEQTENVFSLVLHSSGTYAVSVKALSPIGNSAGSELISVEAMDPLTVQFIDDDGSVLNEVVVDYGDYLQKQTTPSHKGHYFSGWKPTNNYTDAPVTEDMVYEATYTPIEYDVMFYDVDGTKMGETQKVPYQQSAVAPDYSSKTPVGYVFAGWTVIEASDSDSACDYTCVDANLKLQAVIRWENDELPVHLEVASANVTPEGNDSVYTVSVDATNWPTNVSNIYLVAALKTQEPSSGINKTVYAERIKVDLAAGESRNISIPLHYNGIAKSVEVYALERKEDDSTGSAYSKAASSGVVFSTTWTNWSEWSTEKPEEKEGRTIETKTQYRYQDKETTTSSSSRMSGWTQYDSSWTWGAWGSWSSWGPTSQSSSNAKQVESRTEWRYYYFYCPVCGGREPFQGISDCGKYSLSSSNWNDAWFPIAYKNCNSKAYSYTGAKRYTESLGDGKRWNFSTGNLNATAPGTLDAAGSDKVVRTAYRYRTRNQVWTYYFYRWTKWSDWNDNKVTSSSTRNIETQTLYRYRDEVKIYDTSAGTEDTEGQAYHFDGTIDSEQDLSGKTATIMVYQSRNMDPNQYQLQYIGQTTIQSGNQYDFSFIPIHSPSVESGNYVVSLGVQGTTGLLSVDVVKAPVEKYTVRFLNEDGTLIQSQTVEKGGNADVPPAPKKEGSRFVGWSMRTTDVYKNCDIYAQYEKEQYTVAFVDWVNETIGFQSYYYGDMITAPYAPTAEGKTFKGWDVLLNGNATVNDNMVVTAVYDAQTFEVRFMDESGNVFQTQKISYGGAADLPEALPVEGKEFLGWSTENTWWNVTSDMDVYPLIAYPETAMAPVANVKEVTTGVAVNIALSAEEGSVIYYTTDGSIPTKNSLVYSGEIYLEETTQIIAFSSVEGKNDSSFAYLYFQYDEEETQQEDEITALDSKQVHVAADQDVPIEVEISYNPGLISFDMVVECDRSVFYLDDEADGACTPSNITQYGTFSVVPYDITGWKISWISSIPCEGDGVIFTLPLKVDEEAVVGDYDIKLGYVSGSAFNETEKEATIIPDIVHFTDSEIVHTHVYVEEKFSATCTEQGYTNHACICGESYVDSYVPALGHDWGTAIVTVEPTQTTDGIRLYTCQRCGETKTETIPADGDSKSKFIDVPADMWYAEPVAWAVENGVTNGVSDTLFKPDNNCTRGQIVTFLWRANGSPEPTSTVNPFVDVPESQYYYKAVLWAVEKEITTGVDATHFKPDDVCKRGQAVTFLWRAAGKPAPTNSANPFVDVPKDQFYHDAVLWAVEREITTGTTATTFKPDNTCTRGHIVTFLYRDLAQ